jgi:hypothetical protein
MYTATNFAQNLWQTKCNRNKTGLLVNGNRFYTIQRLLSRIRGGFRMLELFEESSGRFEFVGVASPFRGIKFRHHRTNDFPCERRVRDDFQHAIPQLLIL